MQVTNRCPPFGEETPHLSLRMDWTGRDEAVAMAEDRSISGRRSAMEEEERDATWKERTKEVDEDLRKIAETLQSGERDHVDVRKAVESVQEKAELLEIEYERLLRREKKLRDATAVMNRRLEEEEPNGRIPTVLEHFRRENGLVEPCGFPNFCLYSGEDLFLMGKDPVKVVKDLRESAQEESTYKEVVGLLDRREASHWSKYSEFPS